MRGESIKVEIEYSKCKNCGDEILDPHSCPDPLDAVYREYRKRHGLLQPEEIRNWRRVNSLTQGELAKLLGIGIATINRYENGALQDESHDRMLRLVMNADNLLKLIQNSNGVFNDTRKKQLLETLRGKDRISYSLDSTIMINFGDYEPGEYNGYKKLDLLKLYNAILFFSKGGMIKSKLNKLLFYADFKHFKEYTLSITGVEYAHLPYGPVPDNYEIYYASLLASKAVEFMEETYPNGYIGEIIGAVNEPDLNLFTSSELRILASVKEHFEKYSAKQIMDFSHKEVGYQETKDGERISYKYANQLNY
ncbi:MAG: DUF4065 domain-containing protein [Actinobacteria bacterium]|nr:DUF4065 domain-containing protein [Actinomycetota bacterium]